MPVPPVCAVTMNECFYSGLMKAERLGLSCTCSHYILEQKMELNHCEKPHTVYFFFSFFVSATGSRCTKPSNQLERTEYPMNQARSVFSFLHDYKKAKITKINDMFSIMIIADVQLDTGGRVQHFARTERVDGAHAVSPFTIRCPSTGQTCSGTNPKQQLPLFQTHPSTPIVSDSRQQIQTWEQ